jgi:hypothetical protein
MAKLIVTVPIQQVSDYLEVVLDNVRNKFTSGYVDSETYWDIEVEIGEAYDGLR